MQNQDKYARLILIILLILSPPVIGYFAGTADNSGLSSSVGVISGIFLSGFVALVGVVTSFIINRNTRIPNRIAGYLIAAVIAWFLIIAISA